MDEPKKSIVWCVSQIRQNPFTFAFVNSSMNSRVSYSTSYAYINHRGVYGEIYFFLLAINVQFLSSFSLHFIVLQKIQNRLNINTLYSFHVPQLIDNIFSTSPFLALHCNDQIKLSCSSFLGKYKTRHLVQTRSQVIPRLPLTRYQKGLPARQLFVAKGLCEIAELFLLAILLAIQPSW